MPGDPQVTTLEVAGAVETREPIARTTEEALRMLEGETQIALRIDSTRSTSARRLAVEDGQVYLLEWADGSSRFFDAEGLAELERRHAWTGRGDDLPPDGTVVRIPSTLRVPSSERGGKEIALAVLRVLKVEQVIAWLADEFSVARRIDDELMPAESRAKPTVNRLSPTLEVDAHAGTEPLRAGDVLLLHGTFSNTLRSFAGLGGSELFQQRLGRPLRVFGFDHPTLSASPLDNARALAQALPEGSTFDLVGYSRGGLVAELFTSTRSDVDRLASRLERLGKSEDNDELTKAVQELGDLVTAIEAKQLSVRRILRVAAPIGGTVLQTDRLDRWLNGFLGALELGVGQVKLAHPVLAALDTTLPFVKMALLAVLGLRRNPQVFRGLAAMSPSSPIVRILNDHRQDPEDGLRGGQVRERFVFGAQTAFGLGWGALSAPMRLALGQQNDLVVEVPSMVSDLRPSDRRLVVEGQSDLHHLSYFAQEDSRDGVVHWMASEQRGLLSEVPTLEEEERRNREQAGARGERGALGIFLPHGPVGRPEVDESRQDVVVVIPGVMGSLLRVGEDRVWVDLADLMWGGLQQLRIDQKGVHPDGLIEYYYGPLVRNLAQDHTVELGAYDWRRSVEDSAKYLADLPGKRKSDHGMQLSIRSHLRAGRRVNVIAHSMGGLVARALPAALGDDDWRRFADLGGRVVMLGTPNRGSYDIVRLLLGLEPLLHKLALLDLRSSRHALSRVIGAYPGLLELLPWPEFGPDGLWRSGWWTLLADGPRIVTSQGLKKAKTVIERLVADRRIWKRTVYVGGVSSQPTWSGLEPDGSVVRFERTWAGDARVTHASGQPPEGEMYFAEADHGELPRHEASFGAYRELLETGTTELLSRDFSAARTRSVDEDNEPVDTKEVLAIRDPETVFPRQDDLTASIFGATQMSRSLRRRPIELSVVHGDLQFSRHALVVGHYEGTELMGTEAWVDRLLSGRLSEILKVEGETYPGRIGTWWVFAGPAPSNSAVVVGLGDSGALSPGGLARGLRSALVGFMDRRREQPSWPQRLGISTLLLGTLGPSPLTTHQSLRAVIRAVLAANEDQPDDAYIAEIEVIERHQDRALEALMALRDIAVAENVAGDGFELSGPKQIEVVPGHRADAPRIAGTERWWRRLYLELGASVEGRRPFKASFDQQGPTILESEREVLELPLLRSAQQIYESTLSSARSFRSLQMALPRSVRDKLEDDEPLVFVVDETAAQLPWEMIQDDPRRRPPAVRCGFVRQLRTVDGRPPRGQSVNRAILVGNPHGAGDGRLPRAEEEALALERLFSAHGYACKTMVGSASTASRLERRYTPRVTVAEVLEALEVPDARARILHIAAHGTLRPVPQRDGSSAKVYRTALVFPKAPESHSKDNSSSNEKPRSDDDEFMFAEDFENLDWVPEVVFLNCCHLGVTGMEMSGEKGVPRGRGKPNPPSFEGEWDDIDPPRVASSLARSFLTSGARVVVAAGWAVNDFAAQTFAQVFYERMFAGATFGDAVRRAREQAHLQHPATNSWGAFQAYGDPAYRLIDGPPPWAETGLHATSMVIEAAREIQDRAGTSTDRRQRDRANLELRQLMDAAKKRRLLDGETRTALGLAAISTVDWDLAVELLEAAVRDEGGGASFRALEQLVNASDRRDLAHLRKGAHDVEVIRASQTRTWLDQLERLPETAERWALRGAFHKRGARMAVHRREDPTSHLMEAWTAYDESIVHRERAGRGLAYPLLNRLVLDLFLPGALDGRKEASSDNGKARDGEDGVAKAKEFERRSDSELRAEAEKLAETGSSERSKNWLDTMWDRLTRGDASLWLGLFTAATTTQDDPNLTERRAERIAEIYLGDAHSRITANAVDSLSDHLGFIVDVARAKGLTPVAKLAEAVYRKLARAWQIETSFLWTPEEATSGSGADADNGRSSHHADRGGDLTGADPN